MSPADLSEIKARRICVIKPSALGDIVQSLPLLTSLRQRFPQATVAWIANREYVDLLQHASLLDEVIPFSRRDAWGRLSAWARLFGLLHRLHRRHFDLVLDLQGLLRTAIMSFATQAPLRVGLETAREGAHRVCHLTLPETHRGIPAHERYRRVAEALGATTFTQQIELDFSHELREWATEQTQSLPKPIMVVHAGARWMSKRWPAEKFASVASKAIRRLGFSVLVVGGRKDVRPANSIEALLNQFVPGGPVRNLAGQTTLTQLAALLGTADFAFSNDSGPMHLAASLGVPVLGVFTCTSPIRSGPPGPQHELVSSCVSCAGSYNKHCPHRGQKHLACMEELSTERVFQALLRLIEKNRLAAAA